MEYNLTKTYQIRGFNQYKKQIEDIMNKNPEIYQSIAHFVRVAIVEKIAKEKKR